MSIHDYRKEEENRNKHNAYIEKQIAKYTQEIKEEEDQIEREFSDFRYDKPNRIIAFTSTLSTITDSARGERSYSSLLEALDILSEPFELPKDHSRLFRVTWDLDIFIAPILRHLSLSQAQELNSSQRIDITFPPDLTHSTSTVYRISYSPAHWFSAHRKSPSSLPEVTFYHLSQFFPDEGFTPSTLTELHACGKLTLSTLADLGFINLTNLISPVSATTATLERLHLPKITDIPQGASEYACRCADETVWNEVHQIGLFPQAYDYDLVSSFPNVHASLIDTRNGEWHYQPSLDPHATYGYCRCDITINPNIIISPIIYKDYALAESDLSCLFSATGLRKDTYKTKEQIEFIRRWDLGTVTVHDGWYFCHSPINVIYPMKGLIKRLQEAKYSITSSDLTRHIASVILVSWWGKTRELRPNNTFGKFVNFIWAAEITTQVPLKVATFLYNHNIGPTKTSFSSSLIYVATDGCGTTAPIPLTPTDQNLGWRLKNNGEVLSLSPGQIFLGNKRPKGLTLQDMKSLISSKPKSIYWEKIRQSTLTFPQAIQYDALDQLGQSLPFKTTVDLTIEQTRHFPILPKSGNDLLNHVYTSIPFNISEIKK